MDKKAVTSLRLLEHQSPSAYLKRAWENAGLDQTLPLKPFLEACYAQPEYKGIMRSLYKHNKKYDVTEAQAELVALSVGNLLLNHSMQTPDRQAAAHHTTRILMHHFEKQHAQDKIHHIVMDEQRRLTLPHHINDILDHLITDTKTALRACRNSTQHGVSKDTDIGHQAPPAL